MAKGRKGSIKFEIHERIPEVFGKYSSLEVAIGLDIPGNVDEFEAEIDAFLPRTVRKIRAAADEIAASSGFPIPWGKKGEES